MFHVQIVCFLLFGGNVTKRAVNSSHVSTFTIPACLSHSRKAESCIAWRDATFRLPPKILPAAYFRQVVAILLSA